MEKSLKSSESSKLQSQYRASEKWQQDLAFYKIELGFFFRLVDKYFIWLLKERQIKEAQILVSNIHHLNKECENLNDRISENFYQLELQIDSNSDAGFEELNDYHEQLSQDYDEFVESFRTLKSGVFNLSEQMMESEKLGHLLKP